MKKQNIKINNEKGLLHQKKRFYIFVQTEKMKISLTEKEKIIIEKLSEGLSYQAIAEHENIAFNTVKKHIANIYAKLEATNKIEAINKWREWGGV